MRFLKIYKGALGYVMFPGGMTKSDNIKSNNRPH